MVKPKSQQEPSSQPASGFAVPAPELRVKRDRKFLVALTPAEANLIAEVADDRGEAPTVTIRVLAVAAAEFARAQKARR
jgi:hypothetical protein